MLKYIIVLMGKIKLILVLVLIFFVFLISEAVYAYYHTDPLSLYTFKISKFLETKGSTELSFYSLTWAAGVVADRNFDAASKVVDKNAHSVVLPPDNTFKQKIGAYIAGLPDNSFDPGNNYDLGRLFYDLAILSFDNGHPELTPQLLKIGVGFNPNLSFWQVELANYYLQSNQPDLAKSVLDRCMGLPAPVDHCKDYLDNNFLTHTPETVGFLKDTVKSYFDSGRR